MLGAALSFFVASMDLFSLLAEVFFVNGFAAAVFGGGIGATDSVMLKGSAATAVIGVEAPDIRKSFAFPDIL